MSLKPSGILPCQDIREMIVYGGVAAADENFPITPDQIQPASIDLRLGQYAYPVDASFLPSAGGTVLEKLRLLDPEFDSFKIDLAGGAVLEKGRVYLVPLLEKIALQNAVAAFANPKSSTGRLDILTRLIADRATIFDQVAAGYAGNLYIEVAPRSFSIVVKTGERLNQLRFRRNGLAGETSINAVEWNKLIAEKQIVGNNDRETTEKLSDNCCMLPFTVDLQGSGQEGEIIGYRARKHTSRIDLARRDYDKSDFWQPIFYHKNQSLILSPDEFYILMTKEAIAVPPDYAAEMIPYDTRAGEFRVHYAGFFDPGFGWDVNTKQAGSSRGVLEVRSHEVPFLLEHGQIVGWLRYEKMSARPDVLYGQEIKSNYQGQSLKLGKQFL